VFYDWQFPLLADFLAAMTAKMPDADQPQLEIYLDAPRVSN